MCDSKDKRQRKMVSASMAPLSRHDPRSSWCATSGDDVAPFSCDTKTNAMLSTWTNWKSSPRISLPSATLQRPDLDRGRSESHITSLRILTKTRMSLQRPPQQQPQRSRSGDCATCGTRLWKVGLFGKTKPLTVEGLVQNGRCLQCEPLCIEQQTAWDDELTDSQADLDLPRVLALQQWSHSPCSSGRFFGNTSDDDELSQLSDLTLELADGDEVDAHETSHDLHDDDDDASSMTASTSNTAAAVIVQPQSRPPSQPMISVVAATVRTHDRDENRSQSALRHHGPSRTTVAMVPHNSLIPDKEIYNVESLNASSSSALSSLGTPMLSTDPSCSLPTILTAPNAVIVNDTNYSDHKECEIEIDAAPFLPRNSVMKLTTKKDEQACTQSRKSPVQSRPHDIFFDSSGYLDHATSQQHLDDDEILPPRRLSECTWNTSREIYVTPESLLPKSQVDNNKFKATMKSPRSPRKLMYRRHQSMPFSLSQPPLKQITSTNSFLPQKKPPVVTAELRQESLDITTMADIRHHILLLSTGGETDTHVLVQSLEALTFIIFAHHSLAKAEFVEGGGLEILSAFLWLHLFNLPVQKAAMDLLLAFSTTSKEDAPLENDFVGEKGESCVLALLVSMQTHLTDEELQHVGCQILCCLAAASSADKNSNVCDGSLSGAVLAVLNAMDSHKQSMAMQEWGIRALYHQCVISKSAEANKRAVVDCIIEGGTSGPEIIERALVAASSIPILAERICQLFWCLSASDYVANKLSPAEGAMKKMCSIAFAFRQSQEAIPLIQAIFGSLANLYKLDVNQALLDPREAVRLAVEVISNHGAHVEVVTEALCMLSNMVKSKCTVEAMVEANSVGIILNVMVAHLAEAAVAEEGMRALVALAGESSAARDELLQRKHYSQLTQLRKTHENSVDIQALNIRLLSYVSQSPKASQGPFLSDIIQFVCCVMAFHNQLEQVQTAACEALSIIACQAGGGGHALAQTDALGLIMSNMEKFIRSKEIQSSACCVLWSMASAGCLQGDCIGKNCLYAIVKVIREHLETHSVIEMACSAMWTIIHGSSTMQQELVKIDGAIDAITCVLAMYPNNTSVLEKAVGVLSSLSCTREHAEKVVSEDSVTGVVDVLRHNHDNLERGILVAGTCFLRNATIVRPALVSVAGESLCTIIQAMKKFGGDVEFQREACSLLWAISALSNDCKAKILALDGISALIVALDGSPAPDLQEAALGAFSELALTPAATM